MKIQKINQYSGVNSTNFKSAVPVFVHIIPKGKTIEEAVPVTTDKMVNGYMQQLTKYLNDSLAHNKNQQRDSLIQKLRAYFGETVKDFPNSEGIVDKSSKVKAFTCVDGGLNKNKLSPLFYYTTGRTKQNLEKLEKDYTDAKKYSGGHWTAEIDKMNRVYPSRGKNIVKEGYKQFQQNNGRPLAFHVYFTDEYTKTGNPNGHTLVDYKFKPAEITNPTISL